MKKFIISLFVTLATLTLSSCLEGNLEELPVFDDAEIASVRYADYRWKSSTATVLGGEAATYKQVLNVEESKKVSDGQIEVKISVPLPTGDFTSNVRSQVSVNNISLAVTISTAARIEPIGDSPKLGVPGDWSKPNKYRVTAADGKTKKEWTITVTNFRFVE
jgi:hypothetical protein